ncbi:MAG: hypothetical protein K0T01_1378 [Acidimicrobiia bacterium]|nr:hypothetical protein [Acidimicrobiia bacterium]
MSFSFWLKARLDSPRLRKVVLYGRTDWGAPRACHRSTISTKRCRAGCAGRIRSVVKWVDRSHHLIRNAWMNKSQLPYKPPSGEAGGMFWLTRNKFVGSYRCLTSRSRSQVWPGYACLTRSLPSSPMKLT